MGDGSGGNHSHFYSTLRVKNCFLYNDICESNTTFIIPTLQIKKLRFKNSSDLSEAPHIIKWAARGWVPRGCLIPFLISPRGNLEELECLFFCIITQEPLSPQLVWL